MAELFAQRQTKLAERRDRIAELASGLVEDPETNVRGKAFYGSAFIVHILSRSPTSSVYVTFVLNVTLTWPSLCVSLPSSLLPPSSRT